MNNQFFGLLKAFCRLLAIGWLFSAISDLAYLPNHIFILLSGGRPADVASAAVLTTAFHGFLDICFAAVFWFCASPLARLAAGRETSLSSESLNEPKV
jgi:hypothetical protein